VEKCNFDQVAYTPAYTIVFDVVAIFDVAFEVV
jgi:hypothetical protein